MGCVELLASTISGPGSVLVPCRPTLAEVLPAIPATTSGWTIGAVLAAVFAVVVALFKDELWHGMHRARLDVGVVSGSGPFDVELLLWNTSKRTAAEGVTARIIQMEDHPIEYARGPKWMPRLTALDQLLPRISGETSFALAPLGQVHLPLLTLSDRWTSADAALAQIATREDEGGEEQRGGLVILPSADERAAAVEESPGLQRALPSPAMIRLEVAATNVPARLFTFKIWRNLDAPPRAQMPRSPYLRAGLFHWKLEDGIVPYNWAPHGSSSEAADPTGDEPVEQGWWPLLKWYLSAEARREKPRPSLKNTNA
jgi:hypothetical protein